MSKRGELLKAMSEKDISFDTRIKTSDILRNMSDKKKEEKCAQMLILLENSKTEEEFIAKLEIMKKETSC